MMQLIRHSGSRGKDRLCPYCERDVKFEKWDWVSCSTLYISRLGKGKLKGPLYPMYIEQWHTASKMSA